VTAISFDNIEWRAVLLSNLNRIGGYAQSTEAIGPIEADGLRSYLDRCKLLVTAWEKATEAQAQAAQPIQPEAIHEAATPHVNGSTAVKPRRGGWPKGKPRKPPAEVVTQ